MTCEAFPPWTWRLFFRINLRYGARDHCEQAREQYRRVQYKEVHCCSGGGMIQEPRQPLDSLLVAMTRPLPLQTVPSRRVHHRPFHAEALLHCAALS